MKATAVIFLLALALAGCAVVPTGTAHQACELLERCGQDGARAAGEVRACLAEARNGYRAPAECEAME